MSLLILTSTDNINPKEHILIKSKHMNKFRLKYFKYKPIYEMTLQ
jgi:hypothetical protein